MLKRQSFFVGCLFVSVCHGIANAQLLAPSGYTGLINTPNADTLAVGDIAVGYASSNPESVRAFAADGPFGSHLMGFGLLPGLEAVGRLSFDGDLNCDMYQPSCRGKGRDLSVGAKYRLPLPRLPLNTKIAVGFSDYGGAATNFRQAYGVVTSTLGYLDLSLGMSRAEAGELGGGLMSGTFGGATLSVSDAIRMHIERDTREIRAGIAYVHKLGRDMEALVGLSQKITSNTQQQGSQFGVMLRYAMDKPIRDAGQPLGLGQDGYARATGPAHGAIETNANVLVKKNPASNAATKTTPTIDSSPAEVVDIAALVRAYEDAGFSEISVGREGRLWHVRAEPRTWRKARFDALAAAFHVWLEQQGGNREEVQVTLTYMRNPTLQARTNSACLLHDMQGLGVCSRERAVTLKSEPRAMQRSLEGVDWLQEGYAPQFLRPDLELGPAANYTAGTEFGLYDYSIGVAKNWELPLAKGLVWQGSHISTATETSDFSDPNGYWRRLGMNVKPGIDSSLLTYTTPLAEGLWAEASTGRVFRGSGQTFNMHWSSDSGRWRLRTYNGHYETQPQGSTLIRRPSIQMVQYAIVPGSWSVSFSRGTFLNKDVGYHLASTHFWGQHRLQVYYRRTGVPEEGESGRYSFAGFSYAIPIGPKESFEAGPVTLRGTDFWQFGLETKVNAQDNFIVLGKGEFPVMRHGLNDVTDRDRIDLGYLDANMHRLWAAMRDMASKPK
jgi:hypothetical protein